jgi:hypothetical protein
VAKRDKDHIFGTELRKPQQLEECVKYLLRQTVCFPKISRTQFAVICIFHVTSFAHPIPDLFIPTVLLTK